MLHQEITRKIISAFYSVYNTMGYGYLEKVYENCLMIELDERGLAARQQERITVYYKRKNVGDYYADIFVADKVIVEIKAAESLCHENELQLINYLKGTEIEVGLLINFGASPQFKRKIFTNERKPALRQPNFGQ